MQEPLVEPHHDSYEGGLSSSFRLSTMQMGYRYDFLPRLSPDESRDGVSPFDADAISGETLELLHPYLAERGIAALFDASLPRDEGSEHIVELRQRASTATAGIGAWFQAAVEHAERRDAASLGRAEIRPVETPNPGPLFR